MSAAPRSRWGLPGRGELVVAGALVGITAVLLLPVPPWLMDALLTCNLACSLVLLLLAARAGAALQVAAFPTLLLLATLMRLALNVSTTRLILGRADAGRVVQAFGEFASAGNPLVGGVVFLILTVVQFVVIAKGAERVAEVTARFSLDALPGKQMSIDADLRAGLLDAEAAGRRRLELERESQFHGAMDGAMKFIKGDAVAGLVIAAVNLLGGLAVGCLQRGMGAADAARTYTLLTLGDGLVTQIPALLVSTAAGLMVTRVRSERAEQGLGRQLGAQLGAHPEALVLGGGALALVGLLPGMPLVAFGGLGALLAALGGLLARRAARRADAVEPPRSRRGACLALELPAGPPDAALVEAVEAARRAVGAELGLALPPLAVRPGGPAGRWALVVDGAPAAAGSLAAGRAGLEAGLRRAAVRCVGVQETQDLLDALERDQPALVREVVPRLVPPVLLSEVLTRLVEEQVPVASLRAVLTSLAEHAQKEADPAVLAERVREGLRPVISHRLAPEGRLQALLLDPELERRVAAAVSPGAAGSSLLMEPAEAEAVLAGLERALGGGAALGAAPVVVCRPEVRRPFWRLVGALFPEVRVVSFLELEPQVSIQPVGRVGLGAAGAARGGAR